MRHRTTLVAILVIAGLLNAVASFPVSSDAMSALDVVLWGVVLGALAAMCVNIEHAFELRLTTAGWVSGPLWRRVFGWFAVAELGALFMIVEHRSEFFARLPDAKVMPGILAAATIAIAVPVVRAGLASAPKLERGPLARLVAGALCVALLIACTAGVIEFGKLINQKFEDHSTSIEF